LYHIATRDYDPMHALLRALGVLLLLSLGSVWAATEFLAWRLGFQHALGTPLAPHIYAPWAGFDWTFRFSHTPDPHVHPLLAEFGQVWGLLELATAIVVIACIVKGTRRAAQSDLHGSAHWASGAEITQTGLLGSGRGVYVGAWRDASNRLRYLRHDGPEHILAFAPTRSGKGVGLVIPTLLSWPHSAVVHDIKGENYALTAGWRSRELDSRVLKFDPSANDGSSCRFNPLSAVRLRTDFEVKDVQNIVGMLVDPDGRAAQGAEAHWIASSSAFLVGVLLHVLYAEPDKSLGGVAMYLSDPAFTSPTQMYEHLLNTRHDSAVGTHPVVAMAARDMLNRDPRESTSVLSTAIRFLTLFRDPIVARNTASSDFRIADLMHAERPLTLYLVVPPAEIDRLKPLTRLLLNAIMRELTGELKFEDGRSVANYKHRLLLMIDELPALGRLEILQTSLAFMAGYGIKAFLIAQDVSQLSAAYGGAGGRDETIMANCHIQIAFAPNKIETMEMLSKLAGTTTVRNETRSYSGARIGVRSQVMVNSTETQRPLLTPDEVRRLPDDDALIFVAGHSPIYGKKIRYFRDPTFAERARVPAPTLTEAIDERAMAAANAANEPPTSCAQAAVTRDA
jgi:type IV secretion system protein VirD4